MKWSASGRILSTKYHRLIILLVMLHDPRNAGCSTLLNVEVWSRLVVFFVCALLLHRNTCTTTMLRSRRKVTCFYCSTKLSSPPENPNDFTCTSCSSRNRYDPKTGEIMSSDPAMFDTEANRSSFARRGESLRSLNSCIWPLVTISFQRPHPNQSFHRPSRAAFSVKLAGPIKP